MARCNNCTTCDYKGMRSPGDDSPQHCYMFLDEPDGKCMQHTGYKEQEHLFQLGLKLILRSRPLSG